MLEDTKTYEVLSEVKQYMLLIARGQVKALKWVLRARAGNGGFRGKAVLAGVDVHVQESKERVEACNGFVFHRAYMRLESSGGDGVYDIPSVPAVPARPGCALLEVTPLSDQEYPDLDSLVPKHEPVFKITVNPDFLVNTLKGMDSRVELAFYGVHQPIMISGTVDGYEVDAAVMPLICS